MKISIRRTEDTEACLDVDCVCFPHENDSIGLKDLDSWVLWGAFAGSEMVGYCATQVLPDRGTIYLCRAAVLPHARGQGLQRRMVSVRLAHGRKQGYQYAITYVHVDNLASANTLIKSGFTLYEPTQDWKDRKFIFLRRPL